MAPNVHPAAVAPSSITSQQISIQYRHPDELQPHPKQQFYFTDLPPVEFSALCEDIRKRDIQKPLEVLPDLTIVGGHQRLRAAKAIGLTMVPVIVRYDLAALGEEAVINHLILDNAHRRQLTDLDWARLFLQCKRDGVVAREGEGDLRDRLAAYLGCRLSGKSLERLGKVLDLPQPIPDKVAAKEITQTIAFKIAEQPSLVQKKIAKDLANGLLWPAIEHKHHLGRAVDATSAQGRFDSFVARLGRDITCFERNATSLTIDGQARSELEQAAECLRRLCAANVEETNTE